jgi:hypothetical protein
MTYVSDTVNFNIIATAGNVVDGVNPAYTLSDFYTAYPAFAGRTVDAATTYLVDPVIIQMYIDLASACIKQARWHSYWKVAIGWFVAHFVTLDLQSMADANSSAAKVIANAQSRGLMTSKSVGDVSVSYDFNSISTDLDGWAAWKLTSYGQRLATVGKLAGKGGMYVW